LPVTILTFFLKRSGVQSLPSVLFAPTLAPLSVDGVTCNFGFPTGTPMHGSLPFRAPFPSVNVQRLVFCHAREFFCLSSRSRTAVFLIHGTLQLTCSPPLFPGLRCFLDPPPRFRPVSSRSTLATRLDEPPVWSDLWHFPASSGYILLLFFPPGHSPPLWEWPPAGPSRSGDTACDSTLSAVFDHLNTCFFPRLCPRLSPVYWIVLPRVFLVGLNPMEFSSWSSGEETDFFFFFQHFDLLPTREQVFARPFPFLARAWRGRC